MPGPPQSSNCPRQRRASLAGSGSYTADYSYSATSNLVNNIAFKRGGTLVASTTKTYDGLNRLSDEMFNFDWADPGVRTWYNEMFTRVGGAIGHATEVMIF